MTSREFKEQYGEQAYELARKAAVSNDVVEEIQEVCWEFLARAFFAADGTGRYEEYWNTKKIADWTANSTPDVYVVIDAWEGL